MEKLLLAKKNLQKWRVFQKLCNFAIRKEIIISIQLKSHII